MKYTFLSKWTVLAFTIVTFVLSFVGLKLIGNHNAGLGLLLIAIGGLIYAVAWIIALIDSFQERKFGWSIGLLILLPFGLGPLFYSLLGPRNTK